MSQVNSQVQLKQKLPTSLIKNIITYLTLQDILSKCYYLNKRIKYSFDDNFQFDCRITYSKSITILRSGVSKNVTHINLIILIQEDYSSKSIIMIKLWRDNTSLGMLPMMFKREGVYTTSINSNKYYKVFQLFKKDFHTFRFEIINYGDKIINLNKLIVNFIYWKYN